MDETVWAAISNWGPWIFFVAMLLLIVRIQLVRQGRYFKNTLDSMKAQSDLLTTNVETMRKISSSLERIAVALEKRG